MAEYDFHMEKPDVQSGTVVVLCPTRTSTRTLYAFRAAEPALNFDLENYWKRGRAVEEFGAYGWVAEKSLDTTEDDDDAATTRRLLAKGGTGQLKKTASGWVVVVTPYNANDPGMYMIRKLMARKRLTDPSMDDEAAPTPAKFKPLDVPDGHTTYPMAIRPGSSWAMLDAFHGKPLFLCRSPRVSTPIVVAFTSDLARLAYINKAQRSIEGIIAQVRGFPIHLTNTGVYDALTQSLIGPKSSTPSCGKALCNSESDHHPLCSHNSPNPEPTIMATRNSNLSVSNVVTANKGAAKAAAYLEAGRIVNSQLAKVAAKQLPLMVRSYADTPAGKLVIANLLSMAVAHMRPDHEQLVKLAEAATTQAYAELYASVNIEGFLDELLTSKDVKAAMSKLGADEA